MQRNYSHCRAVLVIEDGAYKKQMSLLKSKIETIEERFAMGEIDNGIYQKFKTKYREERK